MYYSHACRLKKSLNYPAYSRFNGYEVENSTSYHIMFKSSTKLVMTRINQLPSGSIYADAEAEGVVEYRKEGKLPYRSPSTLRSSDANRLSALSQPLDLAVKRRDPSVGPPPL